MLFRNFSSNSVSFHPFDGEKIQFDTLEPRLLLSVSTLGEFADLSSPVGSNDCVIEGQLWYDEDQDGIFDSEDFGVPFALVHLSYGSNDYEVISDADGNYCFEDVPADVTLTLDVPDLSPYFAVNPVSGDYSLTISGQQTAQLDFSFYWDEIPCQQYVLAGVVGSEVPMEGIIVYADMNSNFQYDPGEFYGTTDADGYATINHLWSTNYLISVVLPDNTLVVNNAFRQVGSNQAIHVVNMDELSATAYVDAERDFVWAEDEIAYMGRGVYVDMNDNAVFDTTVRSVNIGILSRNVEFHLPDNYGLSGLDLSIAVELNSLVDQTSSASLKLISPRGISVNLLDNLEVAPQASSSYHLHISNQAIIESIDAALAGEYVKPHDSLDVLANLSAYGQWFVSLQYDDAQMYGHISHFEGEFQLSEPDAITDMDGTFEFALPQSDSIVLRSVDGQSRLNVSLPPDPQQSEDLLLSIEVESKTVAGTVRGYKDVYGALMTKYNGWLVELIDPATGQLVDSAYTAYYDENSNNKIESTEFGWYCFEEVLDLEYDIRVTVPGDQWAVVDMPWRLISIGDEDATVWDYYKMGSYSLEPNYNYQIDNSLHVFKTYVYDQSVYVLTEHHGGEDLIRLWRFDQEGNSSEYDAVWTTELDRFNTDDLPEDLPGYYSLAIAGNTIFVGRQMGEVNDSEGFVISGYATDDGEFAGDILTVSSNSIAGSAVDGILYVSTNIGNFYDAAIDTDVFVPRGISIYDAETLELLRIAPVPVAINTNIGFGIAGVIDGKVAFGCDCGYAFVDMEDYTSTSIIYNDRPLHKQVLDSITYSTKEDATVSGSTVYIDAPVACPVIYFNGQAVTSIPAENGQELIPVNNTVICAGAIASLSVPQDIDEDGQIGPAVEAGCFEIKVILKQDVTPGEITFDDIARQGPSINVQLVEAGLWNWIYIQATDLSLVLMACRSCL